MLSCCSLNERATRKVYHLILESDLLHFVWGVKVKQDLICMCLSQSVRSVTCQRVHTFMSWTWISPEPQEGNQRSLLSWSSPDEPNGCFVWPHVVRLQVDELQSEQLNEEWNRQINSSALYSDEQSRAAHCLTGCQVDTEPLTVWTLTQFHFSPEAEELLFLWFSAPQCQGVK